MTFKERLLFSVASWQSWQRYAATTCVVLLLTSAWWLLTFRSLWQGWQQTRTQTEHNLTAQAMQTNHDEQQVTLPAQAQIEPIATVFAQRRDAFFALTSMQQVTSVILSRCALERLRVENYSISPLNVQDWHATSEMKLIILGAFFSIMNFLERLQRYENIIMQRFELKADEECPVTTISGDCAMRLVCTLTIVLPNR